MGTVTLRVRSIVWFVTGAVLAASVTLLFVNAWQADAAPGDTDSTFVPITPCRLADTRPAPFRVGQTGALGIADTETFAVHGTNGECSIPTAAVAVSLNVTALGATTPSFLTFWPDGDQPLAASLNPAPGQPPTPNAVTVDLSGAGAFNVYNEAGSVNVVIDVNGYYVQSSLRELAQRLAAVETSAAALASGLESVEADVAAVDGVQPFTVWESTGSSFNDIAALTTTPTDYLSVTVTAPADGQVSVSALATVARLVGVNPGSAACTIAESTAIPANLFALLLDGGQMLLDDGALSEFGHLAGTKVFDITGGATVEYQLVCEGTGNLRTIFGRTLSATFTPAP